MSRDDGLVRVTITLPASLYGRIKESTDNFSAFVTETLARRVRNMDLADALDRSSGLMADTFQDLRTSEDILTYLRRQRAEWKPDGK